MLKVFLAIVALAIYFSQLASAVDAPPPSPADKQFAARVASTGMLEVRIGQYASANAASIDVKHFAESMVGDHTRANDELKTIASVKGIELPKKLSEQDQQILDRLEKLTGPAFDKAYMVEMVTGHQATIAAFEKEATSGTEIAVKGFAEKMLPTLRQHLASAQALLAKL